MWFLNLLLGPLTSLAGKAFDYFNKKQDVDLEKYKVDGQVDMSLIQAEVAIINARAGVMQHLSWVHKGFGLVCLIYFGACAYDALTEDLFPSIHWDVHELKGLAGITFNMVVGFFFLNTSIVTWLKR